MNTTAPFAPGQTIQCNEGELAPWLATVAGVCSNGCCVHAYQTREQALESMAKPAALEFLDGMTPEEALRITADPNYYDGRSVTNVYPASAFSCVAVH